LGETIYIWPGRGRTKDKKSSYIEVGNRRRGGGGLEAMPPYGRGREGELS